jgi:hypothetical protein
MRITVQREWSASDEESLIKEAERNSHDDDAAPAAPSSTSSAPELSTQQPSLSMQDESMIDTQSKDDSPQSSPTVDTEVEAP